MREDCRRGQSVGQPHLATIFHDITWRKLTRPHTRYPRQRGQFIAKLMAFDLNGDGKVSKEEFLMCARLDPIILHAFGYAGDAGDIDGGATDAHETEGEKEGSAEGGSPHSRRMQRGSGDGGGSGSVRAIKAMKSAAKRESARAGGKRGGGCAQQ